MDRRRLNTALTTYLANPVVKRAIGAGIVPPWVALLETTGRRSGQARRTPVGNGLQGDSFWIVAEHGRRAAYVRNLQANPRVRVKVPRQPWRAGTARVIPDDDPRARLRLMGTRGGVGSRLNAAGVRAMGTDLLTIRVDLDPL